MAIMEQLVQLERACEDLARRFDRAQAREPGATVPSADEVSAVERRIREAGVGKALSTAERGKLEQLTARFSGRAAAWRQLASAAGEKAFAAALPAPPPEPARVPDPEPPPVPGSAGAAGGGLDAARLDEYRRLFARYQLMMERAGEPIPTSLERFVRELEEQRRRLVARGTVVEGFEVVREPSGIRVRPRTRSGGH